MTKKLFLLLSFIFCSSLTTIHALQEKNHTTTDNNTTILVNDEEAFNKKWATTLKTLQEMIPEKISTFVRKIVPTELKSDLLQRFTDLIVTTIKDRFHKLEHTFFQYKRILQDRLNEILAQVKKNIELQKQHFVYGKDGATNSDWILAFEAAQPAILLVLESFKKQS